MKNKSLRYLTVGVVALFAVTFACNQFPKEGGTEPARFFVPTQVPTETDTEPARYVSELTGPKNAWSYLPVVMMQPTLTFTSTVTLTATATSTATPTTTATGIVAPVSNATAPPATTGNIQIISIFANGAGSAEPDEYVQIRNDDTVSIQVQDWTLSDKASHVFVFPSFVMAPGQVCRVYTDEYHSEWCGFNYYSSSAIWNNSGDCAYLKNALGNEVDSLCY